MKLVIIRHAIAVPRGTPEIPDDERPLTPEGEKKFVRAARGLARIVKRPDVILTSPLPRAHRTAVIAAEAFGGVAVEATTALSQGDFEDLARVLADYPAEACVAVVGHEPDLSAILARVLGARDSERLVFKKGGAALVDLPGSLAEGGSLVWFLPPRMMRDLAG